MQAKSTGNIPFEASHAETHIGRVTKHAQQCGHKTYDTTNENDPGAG